MTIDSIILDSSAKLVVTPTTTDALDISAFYADATSAGLVPGNQLTKVTAASEADVVSAPAAGVQRLIKSLVIHNRGGSSNTVQVAVKVGANLYILVSKAIAAGTSWSSNEPDA